MNRLHVVGRKNHGKTKLVVDLVKELAARGVRVGTIKHTHHRHELDTPGKDSYEHRMAGAAVVGIVSPGMHAAFVPTERAAPSEDRYAIVTPMFAACDVVIVEGDAGAVGPKIEVWRAAIGGEPLALHDKGVLAVVTDDPLDAGIRTRPRGNVPRLVDWLLRTVFALR